MSMVDRSGSRVEAHKDPALRGHNITLAEARRLHDILIVILHRLIGLSVPDVSVVLTRGATPNHVYKRLRECPMSSEDAVNQLRTWIRSGALRAS